MGVDSQGIDQIEPTDDFLPEEEIDVLDSSYPGYYRWAIYFKR